MLKIIVPSEEYYNESTGEFIYSKEETILLEHSLLSVSKWESKWKKPFISDKEKTKEELCDYIECMTLNRDELTDDVYSHLTYQNIKDITDYMADSMTATTVKHEGPSGHRVTTSELIYAWMAILHIPFECEKWHLNRLLMLIDVCNEEQKPPKKMSQAQTMKQNRALNRARLRKR